MFELPDTVSRLGEDFVRRARPAAEDLADFAKASGSDLARRARAFARPPEPIVETRSFIDRGAAQAAAVIAFGVAAGLALGAARKAAVQGVEALNGDWLEVLKAEHRAVERLFEALLATTERQAVRRTILLNRIAHALAKHALQEEAVIYPALKEASGGDQAMHLFEEHAWIKIFVHELQEIAKTDAVWIERARAFHSAVQEHVREEEEDIFPAYHARLSDKQNRRLTLGVHREGLKLA